MLEKFYFPVRHSYQRVVSPTLLSDDEEQESGGMASHKPTFPKIGREAYISFVLAISISINIFVLLAYIFLHEGKPNARCIEDTSVWCELINHGIRAT
jgi:hypothetical protein